MPFSQWPRRLAPLIATLCVACGGGGGGGGGGASAPVAPSGPTPAATVAANSTTIASVDPATADDSDLAAFGAAVGDRRIVLLTEATHGDGATFELKTRLVKYLHENKGFDVLFMESGMYDVARIQQRLAAGGDAISVQAPGRIYYMYSRTDAGQAVLKYVDGTLATATPLALWGHDVPMDGLDSTQSLLPGLQAFLAARHSALPQSADWPGFLRVAQQGVALNSTPVASADSASFLAMSTQLATELCGEADPGGDLLQSPAFWCRLAKGVQADYTHLFSATDARTPTDLRDVTGAGNIEWLLDGRLAGRKAIVWLHAVHGNNGLVGDPSCAAADSQECGPGWTNVGTALTQAYGDAVYIADVTAGSGVFDTYNTTSACGAPSSGYTLPALDATMLAYYLAPGGQVRFMAYPGDAAGRTSIASLGVLEGEFQDDRPNAFGTGYQGLFFLPQLAPTATDCAAYPVLPYS
jgi:erythromycin esterase